jgi:hypothetical protein
LKSRRGRCRLLIPIALAIVTFLVYRGGISAWDYYNLHPGTRMILSKLNQKGRFAAKGDQPLADVLLSVRLGSKGPKDGGIPIHVDMRGLQEAGATLRNRVRVPARRGRLKDILDETLKAVGLGYYVREGLLTITSAKAAERAKRAEPNLTRRP